MCVWVRVWRVVFMYCTHCVWEDTTHAKHGKFQFKIFCPSYLTPTHAHALSNFIVYTFYAWNAALCALQHKRNGSFDVTRAENRALYWPIPYSLRIVTNDPLLQKAKNNKSNNKNNSISSKIKLKLLSFPMDSSINEFYLPSIVVWRHGTRVLTCPIHIYPHIETSFSFSFSLCLCCSTHTYTHSWYACSNRLTQHFMSNLFFKLTHNMALTTW